MIWKTYGKLTIQDTYQKLIWKRNRLYAKCLCECWKEHDARVDWLKDWSILSCWCSHQTYLDEIWKNYWCLTISKVYSKRSTSTWKMITYAICDCVCGTKNKHFELPNIKNLGTRSCWCARREKTSWETTKSRAYHTRRRMYESCYNEDHPQYKRRGARGVTVIKEWHTFNWWWRDNKVDYSDYAYFTRKNPFEDFDRHNCIWSIAYNVSRFDLFDKKNNEKI